MKLFYFVDNHKRLDLLFEGFPEDKLGLGHGSFGGADHETDSIDHIHDAFHFSSEVLMAWSVDDVDIVVVVVYACAFGSE